MGHRTVVSWSPALLALGVACSGSGGGLGGASLGDGRDSGSSPGAADGAATVDGSAPSDDAAPTSGQEAGPANDSGGADGGTPPGVVVPKPVGACPTFQNGMVTFNPAAGPRTVQLFLDPASLSKHGPLVLYWYSTYGSPAQAAQALGASLQKIESLGGVVAAPVDNGTGMFPWIDNVDGHMLLADEIVGCAAAAGVDTKRIHSLGFSAGALMTTSLAFGRSSYFASVAMYSGGLTSGAVPPYQDPNNKFAALILTGGATDNVFNTDFQKASQALQTKLKADGHSALYCDHGQGHAIPPAYTGAVGQFLLDHPFGTNPSPYVGALPAALASCTF
jgi:predicted esterase